MRTESRWSDLACRSGQARSAITRRLAEALSGFAPGSNRPTLAALATRGSEFRCLAPERVTQPHLPAPIRLSAAHLLYFFCNMIAYCVFFPKNCCNPGKPRLAFPPQNYFSLCATTAGVTA